ncbi:protein NEOXANTHIN-DEFICIENT 1-like isoform X2 [Canna indica]|uniref:Protein NEOXANTHIN-DEFICIENT 1-like isoform X2 n=1 Tax=Canna indica TaxID=4628 RepID=A0AAQ3KZB8_9LILI|nr:protein NEOXANTHIN-DEFICIENT 1-like isoform X2 [Canna indica]
MGESATSSSGYARGPPWLFKGRALYQLHLVKAEIARAFIPKELKLVEAFGYTLGGLFLAHYDDSPTGLVVIAGIVWNPPTSCAWASRVLVNSHEACRHGRKEIGLPSHMAVFSKRETKASDQPLYKNQIGSFHSKAKEHSDIEVLEMEDNSKISICSISLPCAGENWQGPKIRISLPSFSIYPCRVRAVKAAKISRPINTQHDNSSDAIEASERNLGDRLTTEDEARNQSISILLSKPIMALEFNLLRMQVEAPKIVSTQSRPKKNQVGNLGTC